MDNENKENKNSIGNKYFMDFTTIAIMVILILLVIAEIIKEMYLVGGVELVQILIIGTISIFITLSSVFYFAMYSYNKYKINPEGKK